MMNAKDLELFLKELEAVTNIESPTSSPEGVNEVVTFFENKAKELNLESKRVSLGDDKVGDCLLVSNNLNAEKYDILLLAHSDTVYPIGTLKEASFRVEGNNAKALGVIDDKGCALMAFYALKHLDLSKMSIMFLINSCEETGSVYSEGLIKEYARKSNYTLVLECARENSSCVASRKGVLRYQVDFKGIASHAGNNPEKGASAVNEAANLIVGFANINDYNKGHTFNTVFFKGGDALNVIPDSASIGIEMRYVKPSSIDFLENRIKEILAKPLNANVTHKITKLSHMPPMFDEKNLPKMKAVVEAAGKLVGVDVKWVNAGGGSDGNITSGVGCPTIDGLGPSGGHLHSKENEYIEVDSIIPRCNLLIESIKIFAKK